MSSTIVIGAGMSGLVRARALAARGEDVTLLESSDRPGGAVWTQRRDGFLLELGPNTVRPTRELWALVGELGLAGEALLADPRLPRFVEWNGKLHALPMSPGGLISTKLLSARAKLRLLAEPFRRQEAGPEESVHAFFARRLGEEVADRFIEPFVGGIFAGSSHGLSVAAAFPSLARWDREHGSIVRGAIAERKKAAKDAPGEKPPRGLLSFREGLETLPRKLAADLGSRLQTGVRVESVRSDDRAGRASRWIVRSSRGEIQGDRVVLAAPAWEAARLGEGFAPEAAEALGAIPHPFLAVAHMSLNLSSLPAPLHGFGHLVVPQEGRRILGAVWSSSLFEGRAPSGTGLVTVFLGGSRDPEAVRMSDTELSRIAVTDLAASLAAREDPRVVSLTRYARSIPQYTAGHLARIAVLEKTESRFPGLTFIGNYRGGVSVGDVVKNASVVD